MLEIPRLPRAVARALSEAMVQASPQELSSKVHQEHKQAAIPEVLCGEAIKDEALHDLREGLLEAIRPLGFPEVRDQRAKREFDVIVADELFRRLPMAPRTAADPDVWNYLCCALLPDVARWRFPDTTDSRRFLGGPRNTLQRLWLRAAVLSGADEDHTRLLKILPEDALVQIFERPAVWADWDIARQIACQLADRLKEPDGGVGFENHARRVLLKVRQLMPISNLSALPRESRAAVLAQI